MFQAVILTETYISKRAWQHLVQFDGDDCHYFWYIVCLLYMIHFIALFRCITKGNIVFTLHVSTCACTTWDNHGWLDYWGKCTEFVDWNICSALHASIICGWGARTIWDICVITCKRSTSERSKRNFMMLSESEDDNLSLSMAKQAPVMKLQWWCAITSNGYIAAHFMTAGRSILWAFSKNTLCLVGAQNLTTGDSFEE